ncbi:MAG: VaFE repeat-containing surface-anchored protein, partial [Actinomycetaceae bacterium]|nr:VaFE repeat-containing surface-anchored protein [Actinomycetaceae bacterium]
PATPDTPGTPATPDTPGTPVTPPSVPSTPGTPATPDIPCVTPPAPTTPDTPGTPGTPATPDTPGTPGRPTGETPTEPGTDTPTTPQECEPTVDTTAVDAKDGDKVIGFGQDATVRDHVTYTNLERGTYVIVGTLMDKATNAPVPGATQVAQKTITIGEAYGSGAVDIEFTVPSKQVKAGASWVVFERIYRAADIDAEGKVVGGARPYVAHTDINDGDQTVTVVEPTTPTVVTPKTPGRVTVHQPPVTTTTKVYRTLAKTGASAGVVGAVGLGVIVAGLGLVALRRRQG